MEKYKCKHDIEIIRSKRKSLCLEIKPDLRIIVRAPFKTPTSEIQRFLDEKSSWLDEHYKIVQEKSKHKSTLVPFSPEEIQALADKARRVIPPRAKHFASLLGVGYKKITIRNQVSRWGSCSPDGSLSFNCLLMLCPEDILDYVIIHELCHRKQMNHSPAFWSEVEKLCPDCKQKRKWLKVHGSDLIARLRAAK